MKHAHALYSLAFVGMMIIGCSSDMPTAHARPYIPPLAITIAPESATVPAGGNVIFTAHPSGGEAIRLFVDWTIQEGDTGGSMERLPDAPNGDSSVRYVAPADATGPFHIVASIRNFPNINAVATIHVVR